jgi:hypothetical protein
MVLILIASRSPEKPHRLLASRCVSRATLTKDRSQRVVRLGDSAAGFDHRAACGHQHAVNGAEASALNWNGREANADDARASKRAHAGMSSD